MVAVFTKCGKTGFTYYSNFFGSKWLDKEKKFLDLELTQKKFMGSEWDLLSNKGDQLVLKWMSYNYRRSSVIILDLNMVIVAEVQRTREER